MKKILQKNMFLESSKIFIISIFTKILELSKTYFFWRMFFRCTYKFQNWPQIRSSSYGFSNKNRKSVPKYTKINFIANVTFYIITFRNLFIAYHGAAILVHTHIMTKGNSSTVIYKYVAQITRIFRKIWEKAHQKS